MDQVENKKIATATRVRSRVKTRMAAVDNSPAFPVMKTSKSSPFVSFGKDNDFIPNLVNLVNKSPVQKAIIASSVTYICGKEIAKVGSGFMGEPNHLMSWAQILRRCAHDYKQFGGFYLQVIRNENSNTVSIFHQDYTKVRIGDISETGDPETWIIANDWPKADKKKWIEDVETWPGNVSEMTAGKPYLFHYWDYEPGLDHYSLPGYYASLEYVKADGSLAEFYNNSLENGFTPSAVISMPSNPDDDAKETFQKDMEAAFTGTHGANSVVTLWGENDEVRPVITPFSASGNADVYNNVEGIVFQKIMSANRLATPTLAGVSGSGNLSGNAAELVDGYVLYNHTVIAGLRAPIMEVFNMFQDLNGRARMEVQELDVINNIRETDESTASLTSPATLSRTPAWKRLLNKLTSWIR